MGEEFRKKTENNDTQFFSGYLQNTHFVITSKTNFNDLPVYGVIEFSDWKQRIKMTCFAKGLAFQFLDLIFPQPQDEHLKFSFVQDSSRFILYCMSGDGWEVRPSFVKCEKGEFLKEGGGWGSMSPQQQMSSPVRQF